MPIGEFLKKAQAIRQRQATGAGAPGLAWIWPVSIGSAAVFLLLLFLVDREGSLPGLDRLTSSMPWYSISAIGALLTVISIGLDFRRALLGVPILLMYAFGSFREAGEFLFILSLPLTIVPPFAFIAVVSLASILVMIGFRRRSVELSLLLLVAAMQVCVAVVWSLGMTAAAAFEALPFNLPAQNVFDPHIESVAMKTFWVMAVPIVLGVAGRSLWRFVERKPARRRKGRGMRVFALILLAVVLACIHGNILSFRRMGPSLARSRSPDGRKEILLAPMNCLTDVSGEVLWRQESEFWWHPIGKSGDIFPNAKSVRFAWDDDSRRVQLLRDERPWLLLEFPEDQVRPVWRRVKEDSP